MFLIFNKEKIQTYAVSLLTVAVLIGVANIKNIGAIQVSATERYLPIYNVQTEEPKIAFTMNCAWNADDIDSILETLKNNEVHITFFMVGEWVDKYPEAVKKIYEAGHEIGSHSNKHLWVNKMTRQEFAEDTRIAIGEIENLIGRKVKSFRAPAFSIGKNNDWAFDVLAENGIEYDCSIFPANRDLGGFPHFTSSIPALIKKGVYTIKEFPICPVTLMGKSVTFSGGGYFRLVPLWLQKNFIERMDYSLDCDAKVYIILNLAIVSQQKFTSDRLFFYFCLSYK